MKFFTLIIFFYKAQIQDEDKIQFTCDFFFFYIYARGKKVIEI